MVAAFHRCCMIPIFPVGSTTVFSPIVFLPRSSSDQLHWLGNNVSFARIDNEQVNMLCEAPYYVKSKLPPSWFSNHFHRFSGFPSILLHIILYYNTPLTAWMSRAEKGGYYGIATGIWLSTYTKEITNWSAGEAFRGILPLAAGRGIYSRLHSHASVECITP